MCQFSHIYFLECGHTTDRRLVKRCSKAIQRAAASPASTEARQQMTCEPYFTMITQVQHNDKCPRCKPLVGEPSKVPAGSGTHDDPMDISDDDVNGCDEERTPNEVSTNVSNLLAWNTDHPEQRQNLKDAAAQALELRPADASIPHGLPSPDRPQDFVPNMVALPPCRPAVAVQGRQRLPLPALPPCRPAEVVRVRHQTEPPPTHQAPPRTPILVPVNTRPPIRSVSSISSLKRPGSPTHAHPNTRQPVFETANPKPRLKRPSSTAKIRPRPKAAASTSSHATPPVTPPTAVRTVESSSPAQPPQPVASGSTIPQPVIIQPYVLYQAVPASPRPGSPVILRPVAMPPPWGRGEYEITPSGHFRPTPTATQSQSPPASSHGRAPPPTPVEPSAATMSRSQNQAQQYQRVTKQSQWLNSAVQSQNGQHTSIRSATESLQRDMYHIRHDLPPHAPHGLPSPTGSHPTTSDRTWNAVNKES
jgi:hypothetical protein